MRADDGGICAVPLAGDADVHEALPAGRRWTIPVVAFPVAAALAAASVVRLGVSAHAVLVAAVVAVLVVLAAIDLRHRLLPNAIVLPATAATLACQIAIAPDRAGEWLLGALVGAGLLLVPSLIKPGAIGMGDVKLAALLGVALGAQVLSALMLGLLAVAPVALALLLVRGSSALRATLPLGPFLALGATVVLLA